MRRAAVSATNFVEWLATYRPAVRKGLSLGVDGRWGSTPSETDDSSKNALVGILTPPGAGRIFLVGFFAQKIFGL